MNKQEIYEYLSANEIEFEITEHKAVYNMEEMSEIHIPYPEADAKNLFVRDDKKRNYYLIVVKGNKRVDLKLFKQRYNTRSLSFASDGDLLDIMKLTPGSVTPFGILNDEQARVHVFIDKELSDGGLIGVHPNDNTATVWLKTKDMINIIKRHGNEVTVAELSYNN